MLDLASNSNENEGTSTASNDLVSENVGSCTGLCCTGGVINQPTNRYCIIKKSEKLYGSGKSLQRRQFVPSWYNLFSLDSLLL